MCAVRRHEIQTAEAVVRVHAQRKAELATPRAAMRALDAGDLAEARRILLERERALEIEPAEGETA